ncbi:hypothetical protein [Tessaracoccus caeni]|uniref:hypothetical protein n=1 Tax=Tessaracoccus caeni TaxID=3031239 RepID=UPI0023DC3280|nr:hypothetical protein [Tessaracoccus caeni]MDF1488839.1 hypothetical protein [Tessaracoccus caeni]
MISRIENGQLDWFQSWIETFDAFPSDHFDRFVVLLHPGTALVSDDRFPFASPNVHRTSDDPLSDEQQATLDQILLDTYDPDTECHFALYAGFLGDPSQAASRGFNTPETTWHPGRLNYVLYSAPLRESVFGTVLEPWAAQWNLFLELSYLWPSDRSWFLSSTADTAVTIIGCDDALAQKLLAKPSLDAHEWRH